MNRTVVQKIKKMIAYYEQKGMKNKTVYFFKKAAKSDPSK